MITKFYQCPKKNEHNHNLLIRTRIEISSMANKFPFNFAFGKSRLRERILDLTLMRIRFLCNILSRLGLGVLKLKIHDAVSKPHSITICLISFFEAFRIKESLKTKNCQLKREKN